MRRTAFTSSNPSMIGSAFSIAASTALSDGMAAGVVQERLGIVPDEIDSGHCPALSRPRELAERQEPRLATKIAA